MPDRVIRDELLESERWLTLKDNADRLAFIALLLKADSLGNFTAEPFRLMRLWRDFGINSAALVAKTLTELADHELIRCYEHEQKSYVHIPRFGQRTRYVKRVFPISPWTTDEQKQLLEKNSPGDSQVTVRPSPGAHSRSEVKRSEEKKSSSGVRRSPTHPIPKDFGLSDRVSSWAAEQGVLNIAQHLEYFINAAKAKDYRYADWDRALMNAVTRDWAKIGKGSAKHRKVASA